MDDVWPAIETLIPTIGILGLFYLIMRHIMEGDRRERVAQAQWEREHDLAKGAVAPGEAEARQQNAHLPKTAPGTMDSRQPEETSEVAADNRSA